MPSESDDAERLVTGESDLELDDDDDVNEDGGDLDPDVTAAQAGMAAAGVETGVARRGTTRGRTLAEMFDFLPPAPTREEVAAEGERLQKVLARLGIGSRRVCEDLISARRVRINGRMAELGNRVDVERDEVTIDGVPVGIKPGLVYYVLNKPAGVVTTAKDPQGRATVVEMVPAEPRVFPVGRLDADTEGLLLLTNDGDMTHRLTHPSFGVHKEYLAEVVGTPGPGALRALREGVELDDGWTAPAQVTAVGPGLVRITIHEGRNRQVRRMFDVVGHPVRRLVRTRIGPLADRSLRPGVWRELTFDEVRALAKAVGPAPKPRDRVDPDVVTEASSELPEPDLDALDVVAGEFAIDAAAERPTDAAPLYRGTMRVRRRPRSR